MRGRSVNTVSRPLRARLSAPGSKSVTHRALVAAALARGPSRIHNPLIADDSRITLDGLAAMGIPVDRSDDRVWTVEGLGGRVPGGGRIDLEFSGTSLRFLLCVAAMGRKPSALDGAPRLRERPIGALVDPLSSLGARIEASAGGDGLPATAGGSPLQGGEVEVDASASSQFASGLMLIGARLPGGLSLRLGPNPVSLPYIEVTAEVLEEFGVEVGRPDEHAFRLEACDYSGREFRVEGDYSSASYFLAAPAIAGGRVRVENLREDSRQADARMLTILSDLGCRVERDGDAVTVEGAGELPGFDLDLGDAPDIAPTVAVLGLFSREACRIRGVAHLRIKESDRLEVVAANLRALGRGARALPDTLEIDPPSPEGYKGALIHTAADHRMAMAFAVAGLRIPGMIIDDPACVSKSNPAFWTQFETLTDS
ncbi:hypothetical protein ABI59_12700 [Acidobacteria bacterium Mor1]|nr:hypothetical protein ABI59_12700 [Acidobacteria bacterium Mor1]